MGKKSTPKAPAAPDPVKTANAQAAANTTAAITQANLNRIDQVTPDGSIRYTQIGTNSDGTPRYQQTQTYSPDQQALYDRQNQIAQSLDGLAANNISRVQNAQSTPFSFDGMTPLQTGATPGAIATRFDTGGPLTTNVNSGPIQGHIAPSGQVQTSLNYGSNFNPGDFNDAAKTASDSAYAAAAARLDPQFAQQESDTRARLSASGISENSDAYRREMDNLSRSKTDAYGQAEANAYGQGLAAQQQGYGQALSTRQQQSGETTQAGNFANTAQGQIFGQNAQRLEAANAAQDQRFQQGQANASLNNTAQGQIYNQNQGAAAFANTAENQQFNQNSAAVTQNNQARQQQIDEATYLRNMPLNDISALLGTGGGVQQPSFTPVSQVGVAAPDYQGAVYANYNAANQQYQNALQARSQGLGSIFGLAGSLGAAAITASDKRFKVNIRRIGTLANGIATYTYNYIWSKAQEFGVLAQDAVRIIPDAVLIDRNGMMYVDYRKVW